MTTRFRPIDKLPLFACEEAIATALLGPGKYAHWKQIAPLLERHGFPTIDGLMGGRHTPAIRKFFDLEYKVEGDSNQVASAPHGPADLGAWQRKKNARHD